MSSTTSKVFFDTNVLVYALDGQAPVKRARCRGLLREAAQRATGVISTQVMQEFFVVATRKLGVDPIAAKAIVQSFENFEVVSVEPSLVYSAIDCAVLDQLSFWDALIVVSAESAHCGRLITEDLSHHQVIRGVCVENPFFEG